MARWIAGLLVAALCWVAALRLEARALDDRATWPAIEENTVLPPTGAAPILSLGYRELAADLMWSRLLVYYGSSRIGDSDFRYLEQFIDTVLALDPHFQRVYRWAAYSVTHRKGYATQEELALSVRYLERAMAQFPDDYEYFWLAGLRYWLDLQPQDEALRRRYRERGAELIEQAMRKPNAPPGLATLAASLRSELGQLERALADLQEMILTTDNLEAREKMVERFALMSDDRELADELAAARERFDAAWKAEMPYAPPTLYVIMGDEPSPVIDFEELANERDLFGAGALGDGLPGHEQIDATADDAGAHDRPSLQRE
jgi:hypothetical protein